MSGAMNTGISSAAPATRPESVGRTLAIAVCVALVCSAMVTIAVEQLRPVQAAFAAIERNRAIVIASGLADTDASDGTIVDAYLELDIRVMDRASGTTSDRFDPRTFDHWTATEDAAGLLPIYGLMQGDRIATLVLPVDGDGMCSRMYGYLALEPDLNTVARLVIHDHGETPGIGDRIQDPGWLATWQGKRLRDDEGELRIEVSGDATIPAPYRVDTITGATVTSRAVGRMIRERVQDYAPILDAYAKGTGAKP